MIFGIFLGEPLTRAAGNLRDAANQLKQATGNRLLYYGRPLEDDTATIAGSNHGSTETLSLNTSATESRWDTTFSYSSELTHSVYW
jgi:hypothetical protein